MRYIFDGHNIIGQMPDLSLRDENKEAELALRLRLFLQRSGQNGVLVFDKGQLSPFKQQLGSPRLQVLFASQHGSADALIANLIRAAQNPAEMIVVSNDRQIQGVARRNRVRIQSVTGFLAMLASPSPARQATPDEKKLSQAEVDEWMQLFSSDANE